MPSVEWNKETWSRQLEEHANSERPYYGSQWGDPDPRAAFPPALRRFLPEGLAAAFMANRFGRRIANRFFKPKAPYYPELYRLIKTHIEPHVTPSSVVLEIGPGGGRWTRYLLRAREIILVDIVPEFFGYIRERFPQHAHKLRFYETQNHELNGIAAESVDYVLTFDAFVHIEPEGIQEYLTHIARVLKPNAVAVIHYGDIGKQAAQENYRHFAPMTGAQMDAFMQSLPQLKTVLHDREFLLHSNLIVLQKAAK